MCKNKYAPQMPHICPNYLRYINGGSMPKYLPHMKSLASTLWPGVLYTNDNDVNAFVDNNDYNTARLHSRVGPLTKLANNLWRPDNEHIEFDIRNGVCRPKTFTQVLTPVHLSLLVFRQKRPMVMHTAKREKCQILWMGPFRGMAPPDWKKNLNAFLSVGSDVVEWTPQDLTSGGNFWKFYFSMYCPMMHANLS